ncbi:unnamed protein product [Amoebophrya sp. A120]|nr:unnamed protein product [Amoebophrya sp. A120]|eukprot:GSA120T00017036001.1
MFRAGDLVLRELEGICFEAVILRSSPSPVDDSECFDICFADDQSIETEVDAAELKLKKAKTVNGKAATENPLADSKAPPDSAEKIASDTPSNSDEVDVEAVLQKGLRKLFLCNPGEQTTVVRCSKRNYDGRALLDSEGNCLVKCSHGDDPSACATDKKSETGVGKEKEPSISQSAAALGVMFDGTADASSGRLEPSPRKNAYLKTRLSREEPSVDVLVPSSSSTSMGINALDQHDKESQSATEASTTEGEEAEQSAASDEDSSLQQLQSGGEVPIGVRGVRIIKQSKEKSSMHELLFVQPESERPAGMGR